jgi:hypothetical protein
MGDATSGPIRPSFNPQLRGAFRGATVTSDAGLLLPRELDERLGLSALIERHLSDPRTGYNGQFPYSRLAGYEDTNDTERLAEDPTFRMLASRERRETSIALTSTLHWFETEVLAEERNYQGLARLNTALIQHAVTRSATQRVTLERLAQTLRSTGMTAVEVLGSVGEWTDGTVRSIDAATVAGISPYRKSRLEDHKRRST